jgi:Protein of unknown function (DUF2971)
MILDRWYDPSEKELIYHYCGPDAFVAITTSRALWLSAYWTMNDATEREFGYVAFGKAMKELEREVDRTFLEHVTEIVNGATFQTVLMIGSFSLEGDLLSQWRGYADDARGFAIGFSAKEMQATPAKQLRVLYDEDLQVRELLGNLRHVYKYERSIGLKYDNQFQSHIATLGLDLCAYKNPLSSRRRRFGSRIFRDWRPEILERSLRLARVLAACECTSLSPSTSAPQTDS